MVMHTYCVTFRCQSLSQKGRPVLMDGGRFDVAGELKDTGQRLFTVKGIYLSLVPPIRTSLMCGYSLSTGFMEGISWGSPNSY